MIVSLHRSFKKQYNKSPKPVQRNFDDRLRLFESDQRSSLLNNHPLTGDRLGQWSINVTGDWRAIYEFISFDSIVFVEIGTHDNLFRK